MIPAPVILATLFLRLLSRVSLWRVPSSVDFGPFSISGDLGECSHSLPPCFPIFIDYASDLAILLPYYFIGYASFLALPLYAMRVFSLATSLLSYFIGYASFSASLSRLVFTLCITRHSTIWQDPLL